MPKRILLKKDRNKTKFNSGLYWIEKKENENKRNNILYEVYNIHERKACWLIVCVNYET